MKIGELVGLSSDGTFKYISRDNNNESRQITTNTDFISFCKSLNDLINSITHDLFADARFDANQIALLDMLTHTMTVEYEKYLKNPPDIPGLPPTMSTKEYVEKSLGRQIETLTNTGFSPKRHEEALSENKPIVINKDGKTMDYQDFHASFQSAIEAPVVETPGAKKDITPPNNGKR